MSILIGIHGRKQVGKDTIANYLVQEYDFQKIAFADKLEEAVANLFDIEVDRVDQLKDGGSIPLAEVILQVGSTEWSFSWREFLQRFGTEMGRNTFGENFWIRLWDEQYRSGSGDYIVVPDVRFENEAIWISGAGGYIIEVTRPGYESDGHVSEAGIPEDLIDAWIDNNKDIGRLYDDVDQLMEDITNGKVDNLRVSGRH